MARSKDVFMNWVGRLVDRMPRADWPPPASEYWQDLRAVWGKYGISPEVADSALLTMIESPAPFPDQFVSAFLATVRAVRAASGTGPYGVDPTSYEAARIASGALRGGQGCEWCDGSGTLTVYHSAPAATRGLPATAAAHCVCPAGRWVRSNLRSRDAATCRRYVDVAEVLECRTPWMLSPPGVLVDEAEAPDGLGMLKSLVDGHRMERIVERNDRRTNPIGAAEVAFAQGLPEAEKARFLALSGRDRGLVMRANDPVLAPQAAALMGRETAVVGPTENAATGDATTCP